VQAFLPQRYSLPGIVETAVAGKLKSRTPIGKEWFWLVTFYFFWYKISLYDIGNKPLVSTGTG
jgi:hypothetical protein